MHAMVIRIVLTVGFAHGDCNCCWFAFFVSSVHRRLIKDFHALKELTWETILVHLSLNDMTPIRIARKMSIVARSTGCPKTKILIATSPSPTRQLASSDVSFLFSSPELRGKKGVFLSQGNQ
jgi:hypothetical protein